MSDLAATGCGSSCGNSNCGCGNNFIWIILLLCCCNGENGLLGSGDCGCGCEGNNNSCLWIIILLFCCGGCGC